MIKKNYLLLLVILANGIIYAQAPEEYKDGYVLKGKDTIWCKVLFNSKHEHGTKAIPVIIDNEEITFYAGGSITGYGVKEDNEEYNYGTVDVEISVVNRRMANLLFVKKIVAGTIDLYEYSYSIRMTKRTTVNGIEKPGSTSTTTQKFTTHYIAKIDTAAPMLATPTPLTSFRKKDLEPYIRDNTVMMANTEKRFSLKELFVLLKEYNNWCLEKKSL